jgi:hypothetical protein
VQREGDKKMRSPKARRGGVDNLGNGKNDYDDDDSGDNDTAMMLSLAGQLLRLEVREAAMEVPKSEQCLTITKAMTTLSSHFVVVVLPFFCLPVGQSSSKETKGGGG